MEQGWSGKRVVVTGGSRGIGRAVVTAFADAGARVVTCCRGDGAEADELRKSLGDDHVVLADVATEEGAALLIDRCRSALGGIDALVNNAGVDGQSPLEELDLEEWRRVTATDLTGPFLVTRAALPLLGDGAAIVNIGSALARRGMAGRAHYTAAKAGLLGLSRSLAKELGGRGIRVNTIEPGIVETEPQAGLPPHVYRGYCAANPLGRLAQPAEIAAAALFLSGPGAGYLTGSVLTVDGGI